MHEYKIETDCLDIELVEPQIKYAEDIWNFRQEIINNDANSENQFAGCGCIAFHQMMDDIKSGKDAVSYVLVFKLSRFGRNAADVLATLQVMQDFGVNLICVEDGIDSSKDAGKLMIGDYYQWNYLIS